MITNATLKVLVDRLDAKIGQLQEELEAMGEPPFVNELTPAAKKQTNLAFMLGIACGATICRGEPEEVSEVLTMITNRGMEDLIPPGL